jgi:hypothetical protein
MRTHKLAADLIRSGDALWSSVACEMKRDRIIVYARLSAHRARGVQVALVESERVLNSVLAGCDWVAAVQWSDRLCRTFKSPRSGGASSS